MGKSIDTQKYIRILEWIAKGKTQREILVLEKPVSPQTIVKAREWGTQNKWESKRNQSESKGIEKVSEKESIGIIKESLNLPSYSTDYVDHTSLIIKESKRNQRESIMESKGIISKLLSDSQVNEFLLWISVIDVEKYPSQTQIINQVKNWKKGSMVSSILSLYRIFLETQRK